MRCFSSRHLNAKWNELPKSREGEVGWCTSSRIKSRKALLHGESHHSQKHLNLDVIYLGTLGHI
jgi:hypothetical protein